MKILTRTRFDKIDRYLAEAALLLRKAEVVCRNAHRTQRLHLRIDCALIVAKDARSEIEKGWRNGYLVPPRTRKVARMEQNERKRITMGGPSKAQGAHDRLPSGGCRKGEKEPEKVKT
jgi:hypothetical protein